jgi:hypothetical protein
MTWRDDRPGLLSEFIAERTREVFRWGANDCALFAADWVRLATGRDPAKAFRGAYSTAIGAAKALRAIGAGDLLSTWTSIEGEPLASPKLAQRGDVVAVETDEGPALAICLGAEVAAMSPDGIAFLPLAAAIVAWRV